MEIPILSLILNRLKILFLHLVGYLKRALCCFSRRRRDSCESVPLIGVGIVPSSSIVVAESWLQWEEGNVPESVVSHQESKRSGGVQDHIELYRQQTMALARKTSEEIPEEAEENYFQDMTPTLTKQKKLFIQTGKKQREESIPSLSLGVQIAPLENGNELGEWEENPGWDDDAQLDCDQTIDSIVKEKKRIEREKRIMVQQQRRMERHSRSVPLGAKIS